MACRKAYLLTQAGVMARFPSGSVRAEQPLHTCLGPTVGICLGSGALAGREQPRQGWNRQVNQVAILYPVFVQVLLTLVVYALLAAARFRAAKFGSRQRGSPDIALGRYAWPEDAEKRANNQRNQFELPVLFYAVTAFALLVGAADLPMVVLAWAFVGSRVVHAAIHIGPNKVRWRTPAFTLGVLILAAMWVRLFLHVVARSA